MICTQVIVKKIYLYWHCCEIGVGVGVRTEITAFSPLCKQRRLKLMLCCTFHTLHSFWRGTKSKFLASIAAYWLSHGYLNKVDVAYIYTYDSICCSYKWCKRSWWSSPFRKILKKSPPSSGRKPLEAFRLRKTEWGFCLKSWPVTTRVTIPDPGRAFNRATAIKNGPVKRRRELNGEKGRRDRNPAAQPKWLRGFDSFEFSPAGTCRCWGSPIKVAAWDAGVGSLTGARPLDCSVR